MGSLDGISVVLFVVFALTIAAMYILVRRQLAPVGMVAGIGTVVNVIVVMLIALAENNMALQAIIVGLVVGVLFSGTSVAMAAYFRGNELSRAQIRRDLAASAPSGGELPTGEPPKPPASDEG